MLTWRHGSAPASIQHTPPPCARCARLHPSLCFSFSFSSLRESWPLSVHAHSHSHSHSSLVGVLCRVRFRHLSTAAAAAATATTCQPVPHTGPTPCGYFHPLQEQPYVAAARQQQRQQPRVRCHQTSRHPCPPAHTSLSSVTYSPHDPCCRLAPSPTHTAMQTYPPSLARSID